jgi:cardiolipin synthase
LRNHRKILVVDGEVAFTGGMNLGDRHLVASSDNHRPVVDAHFRVHGPVVTQIEDVFLADWTFVTGAGPAQPPRPVQERHGDAICRAVVDGPDEDLDSLVTILVGAISSARTSVAIMTPYFLPTPGICAALQAAALRGVAVDVILPDDNNLPFVDWATRNMLGELLHRGVRVYYQPPPFAHSKLFLVDEHYAQVGSANMDPRSLRLNFELVVEVYDEAFTGTLAEHFRSIKAKSTELTIADLDGRPIHVKARDAIAWLFSPYL